MLNPLRTQVFQVALSFMIFPKVISWKYVLGGMLVFLSLYLLNKLGTKKQHLAGTGSGSSSSSSNATGAAGNEKEHAAVSGTGTAP